MKYIVLELKKIMENKLLWVLIPFLFLFVVYISKTDTLLVIGDTQYQNSKQYLNIFRKYPGDLRQYEDEIRDQYAEIVSKTDEFIYSPCDSEDGAKKQTCYQINIDKNKTLYAKYKAYQMLHSALDKRVYLGQNYLNFPIDNVYQNLYSIEKTPNHFVLKNLNESKQRLEDLNEDYSVYANSYYISNIYIGNLNLLIISILLCLIFGLIPLFINDRKNKLDGLNYSSKVGRILTIYKFLSGLIYSLGIFVLFYGVYFYNAVLMNGYQYYKNNPVYDYYNSTYPTWSNMTWKQYFLKESYLLLIGVILLAFIILLISKFSKNMLVGMMWSVLFIIGQFVISIIIYNLFKLTYLNYIFSYLMILPALLKLQSAPFVSLGFRPSIFNYPLFTNTDDYLLRGPHWILHAYLFNSGLVLLITGVTIYFHFKKEDVK